MPTSPAIHTTGLTKRYGDLTAVDSLDLRVERGQIFGFLGPNGAGKTTTVKLLLGLIRPSFGDIQILGQRMPEDRKRLLLRIGAMVEGPAFYPFLTGRENLIVLAKMARLDEKEVDLTLERVGLAASARRSYKGYSMGMKQRLAIAAALLRKPELVLLDEPTSGLDPTGQRDIRALIPQLAEHGCTVFISSHMMQEVEEICSHVGILRTGRLLRTAPVADLIHANGQAVFEIVTDNAPLGVEILRSIAWVDNVAESDGRLIVKTASERASDINRALAEHGVYASEIHERARSLEDVFFEAIEAQVT